MKGLLIILIIASLFSPIYCLQAYATTNNQILINEVEPNPLGTDNGTEKVELYNPSNTGIDVGGWTVSSTADRTATVVINEGTTIAPKGYLIVGRDSQQQWLDNIGEGIIVRNELQILIDSVGPFSDQDNDESTWQRSPDGQDNWVFSSSTTLGSPNFGSLVFDPESPSLNTSERPIPQPEPTPSANSSVEITLEIQPSQNLTMSFIDVGQGDSILVILPNTKTLLIDGGERQSSGKVLSTLQGYGLSYIDVMVATHPHADHIGGLIDVINNVNVGQVLDSGQVHTTRTFEDLLDTIYNKQIPLRSVSEGESINLDPTVKIDVLNPPASIPDGSNNEAEFNDNSVVLKLTYGNFSALLTGDMEERNEARLVFKNATTLDADVLKAGHHGSRTSSSLAFLNAVTPEVVIISLGAGNSYGHPHQEALDRISAFGAQFLHRTDIDGTITLISDAGGNISILTEECGKAVDIFEFQMVCLSSQ
ncbi:MAG TPA: MBL fold metallo-hydrolase [Nitrososphaera sp.]|nr:MBL fold metallo-hydrolase [Nitrososphaera sp.]